MVAGLPPDQDQLRRPLLEVLKASQKVLTLKVEGESMLPFLRTGDSVTISPCQPDEISVADIVAYQSDTGIAVHRVLRKGGSHAARLYQAGDNLAGGSWLSDNQVYGKVSEVIRADGHRMSIANSLKPTEKQCRTRYWQIQTVVYSSLLFFRPWRFMVALVQVAKKGIR